MQVATPGRTADEVQLPAIHATLNVPPYPLPLSLPLNNKETALPSLLQETTQFSDSKQPLFSVGLLPLKWIVTTYLALSSTVLCFKINRNTMECYI